MERLAHGIEHAVREGEWKPFRLCKNGPPLTHLFFADDLLLFGQADIQTAEAFSNVLEEFCVSSGMKISIVKTSLFLSKNVCTEERRQIKEVLGVRVVDNLGRYLGVPLLHQRIGRGTYTYILDKMKEKIASWSSNQISFAGRITLAQTVLNTMPLYAMQTSSVPLSTCEEMEKTIRSFVWGSNLASNCLSKVAWSKIKRPKEKGGLGFRDLHLVNVAFGMKACWEILKKPESFWGRLLCAKYKFEPSLGFDPYTTTSCTPFWRLVCSSWTLMWRNLVWVLGTGKSVQFWNHRWVPMLSGPLSESASQLIPEHLLYKTVDFFVENSAWNWSKFQHLVPREVVEIIAAIMPPEESQGEDVVVWGPSSSGVFSIHSAYDGLREDQRPTVFLPWRRVWSWYGPQRIKIFFWLLLNNGVLVNEERARRQLSTSAVCSMCGHDSESGLHMLRDCLVARQTWEGLLRYGEIDDFFDSSLSLAEWIIRNISSKLLLGSGIRWCTLFGVGCWQIWKNRCDFIFKGNKLSPISVMARIMTMVWSVEEAKSIECIGAGGNRRPILVRWCPPSLDSIKLNTDASLEGSSSCAFGGGLFRDATGSWKGGFATNIGVCSILTAEIWCIYYGLQVAKTLGFRKLEVESDSFVGVSMIMGLLEVSICCRAIVHKVQELLKDFDSMVVQHVHREGNFAADFMSHYAYRFHRGMHVLEAAPVELRSWLLHDRIGVSYIR